MSASKSLVGGGLLSIFAFGVGHDIAANADVVNGDDNDHTPPYVVAMTATAPTASMTIFINTVTGDEITVPPVDKPRAGTGKPAADAQLLAALKDLWSSPQ